MFTCRRVPPCPGNPEDYVLVQSKEGVHWRKKRGTVRPARLNPAFLGNAHAMAVVSPAAKRVIAAMRPFLRGISRGRLNVRIADAFRRSLKETGSLRLSYLKGLEFQAQHPMDGLVKSQYTVSVRARSVRVEVPFDHLHIEAQNRLATEFYFELVLLYGDANEEWGLRTENVESPLYVYGDRAKRVRVLELDLPDQEDWCVILKVNSLEGNYLAVHPMHYRMRVIEGARPVKEGS
jgi:hypothetical protein